MLAFSGGQANRMEAGVGASGAAPVWDLAGSACQELEGVTNSVVIGVAGLEDGTGRDVTLGFHGDGEGALVESLRKHREDASLVFLLHQWWPHHRVMGQHIHALAGQCLVKELGGPSRTSLSTCLWSIFVCVAGWLSGCLRGGVCRVYLVDGSGLHVSTFLGRALVMLLEATFLRVKCQSEVVYTWFAENRWIGLETSRWQHDGALQHVPAGLQAAFSRLEHLHFVDVPENLFAQGEDAHRSLHFLQKWRTSRGVSCGVWWRGKVHPRHLEEGNGIWSSWRSNVWPHVLARLARRCDVCDAAEPKRKLMWKHMGRLFRRDVLVECSDEVMDEEEVEEKAKKKQRILSFSGSVETKTVVSTQSVCCLYRDEAFGFGFFHLRYQEYSLQELETDDYLLHNALYFKAEADHQALLLLPPGERMECPLDAIEAEFRGDVGLNAHLRAMTATWKRSHPSERALFEDAKVGVWKMQYILLEWLLCIGEGSCYFNLSPEVVHGVACLFWRYSVDIVLLMQCVLFLLWLSRDVSSIDWMEMRKHFLWANCKEELWNPWWMQLRKRMHRIHAEAFAEEYFLSTTDYVGDEQICGRIVDKYKQHALQMDIRIFPRVPPQHFMSCHDSYVLWSDAKMHPRILAPFRVGCAEVEVSWTNFTGYTREVTRETLVSEVNVCLVVRASIPEDLTLEALFGPGFLANVRTCFQKFHVPLPWYCEEQIVGPRSGPGDINWHLAMSPDYSMCDMIQIQLQVLGLLFFAHLKPDNVCHPHVRPHADFHVGLLLSQVLGTQRLGRVTVRFFLEACGIKFIGGSGNWIKAELRMKTVYPGVYVHTAWGEKMMVVYVRVWKQFLLIHVVCPQLHNKKFPCTNHEKIIGLGTICNAYHAMESHYGTQLKFHALRYCDFLQGTTVGTWNTDDAARITEGYGRRVALACGLQTVPHEQYHPDPRQKLQLLCLPRFMPKLYSEEAARQMQQNGEVMVAYMADVEQQLFPCFREEDVAGCGSRAAALLRMQAALEDLRQERWRKDSE